MAPTKVDVDVDDESHRKIKLFEDGTLSDCSFSVGIDTDKHLFKAHKIVLALASPVFQSMFFGDLKSEKDTPISVVDITPECFKKLLQYIYFSKVDLSSFDDAYELYPCARKYLLSKLASLCKIGMSRMLKSSNVCMALELGVMFEDKQLQQLSLEFIKINTMVFLNDSAFANVQLSTILALFEHEEMTIPCENELLLALNRWAKKECERKGLEEIHVNLREVVGSATEKIRFLSMNPTEFSNGVSLPSILSNEEITSIMVKLSNVDSSIFPLPSRFSTRTDRRNVLGLAFDCWTQYVYDHKIVSTSEFMLKSSNDLTISKISYPKHHNVIQILIEQQGRTLAIANVTNSTADSGQISLPNGSLYTITISTH